MHLVNIGFIFNIEYIVNNINYQLCRVISFNINNIFLITIKILLQKKINY